MQGKQKFEVARGSALFAHAVTHLELSLPKEDRLRLAIYSVQAWEHSEAEQEKFNRLTSSMHKANAFLYPMRTAEVDDFFRDGFRTNHKYRFGLYLNRHSEYTGQVLKLILCSVAVGKSLARKEGQQLEELPAGYSSVYISGTEDGTSDFQDTYTIYNGAFAFPTCIIEFLLQDIKIDALAIAKPYISLESRAEGEVLRSLEQLRKSLQSQIERTTKESERYSHAAAHRSECVRVELQSLMEEYLRTIQHCEEHKFELSRTLSDVDRVVELVGFSVSHSPEASASLDDVERFTELKLQIQRQLRMLEEASFPPPLTTKDKIIEELRGEVESKDAQIAILQAKLAKYALRDSPAPGGNSESD